MNTPETDLRILFQLSRMFRNEDLPPTARIEQLVPALQSYSIPVWNVWSQEGLSQARHYAEEIIVHYVSYFCDLSVVPVTYYKREKWIRRHLDQIFSGLFHEIQKRSNLPSVKELILEEPIYYLLQLGREKSFPKAPKSHHKRPHAPILKIRFCADLSNRIDSEDFNPGNRKVLLPYELK